MTKGIAGIRPWREMPPLNLKDRGTTESCHSPATDSGDGCPATRFLSMQSLCGSAASEPAPCSARRIGKTLRPQAETHLAEFSGSPIHR